MQLQNLHIVNYKNYAQCTLHFSPAINFIVGQNGSGKTNLLDAVHYLCFCRSYFAATDTLNIRHNQGFFRLDGNFITHNGNEKIVAKIANSRKKEISRNNVPYKKLSEHIGLLPLVMIAPDDVDLIKGGSEDRRKLIDSTLSQFDSLYLQCLIKYNKLLLQRNSLLKRFYEQQRFDSNLLLTYDEQLAPLGQQIYEKRQIFQAKINPLLQQYYAQISEAKETVSCLYESPVQQTAMTQLLQQNRQADRYAQRTTQGIHRDNLVFQIKGYPLKKMGSQGQQKSYLIALKFALYHLLQQHKQQSPILLLDDIFDRLDDNRICQIIKMVSQQPFGQVFISDTHQERVQSIFDKFAIAYKIFHISEGTLHAPK